jgi:hypothetical protein
VAAATPHESVVAQLEAPTQSNKPMVPTAHDVANGCPLNPMRRHMGRPLGRRATSRSRTRGVDEKELR